MSTAFYPFLMEQEGLQNIGMRMNDRVTALLHGSEHREEMITDFVKIHQFDKPADEGKVIDDFMNHGMSREEAEKYCRKQNLTKGFIEKNREDLQYISFMGALVCYGWK